MSYSGYSRTEHSLVKWKCKKLETFSWTQVLSQEGILQLGKKKICVFTVLRPSLIFGPDPKLFIALSVENYLNTLFLPSNVVFHV